MNTAITPPVRVCAALLLLSACSAWNGKEESLRKQTDYSKISAEQIYNHGVDALHTHRYSVASDQFDAGDQNYAYSAWAVNAQLMEGYSDYLQNKYTDAIGA